MYTTVNGADLYYEVTGSGKPLILLHGNGESHRIFRRFVSDLGGRRKVYAIDSRCHGKSGKKLPLSYDLLTADVAEFIRKLEIESPAVMGFSDGGIVCLLLAADYPDLVGEIIAMGANADPGGLKPSLIRIMNGIYRLTKSPKFRMMLTEPHITAERLSRISCPAHIIAGTKDLVLPEHTRFIAESIGGATLDLLEGESHTGYVVNSPKLYGIVEKYL